MSKADAKAYAKYIEEQRRYEATRLEQRRHLAELEKLRRYLIYTPINRVSSEKLIAAIDDFAGELTGDRTALHDKGHSIP